MPLRNGYAQEVYIVTSGEKMALFAAVNIALAVDQFRDRGYARLKGVIQNSRGIPDEQTLVQAAADDMDSRVVIDIPRDTAVQRCEDMSVTVVEGEPNSDMAGVYRRLAELVASDG